MCSSLLQLIILVTTVTFVNTSICASTTNCTACVTSGDKHLFTKKLDHKFECHYVPMTQECHWSPTQFHSKTSYVNKPDQCTPHKPKPGPWSALSPGHTKTDNISGCTNIHAINYRFLATYDDGSCEYPPKQTQLKDYGRELPCRCSVAQNEHYPYGRFCGLNYAGGPGQQPCDQLDKCCQVYSWCMLQPSTSNCACQNTLMRCAQEFVNSMNPAPTDTEKDSTTAPVPLCPGTMTEQAATHIIDSVRKFVEDPVRCPPAERQRAVGNATANCGLHGVPDWEGGCKCDGDWEGRTCTCSRTANCSSNGKCTVYGKCKCESSYYGHDCSKNWLPIFLGLLGSVIVVLVIAALVSCGCQDRAYFTYDPLPQNPDDPNSGLYKWLHRQQQNHLNPKDDDEDDRLDVTLTIHNTRSRTHTLDKSEVESILTDDFDLEGDLSLDELLGDDPIPPPSATSPLPPYRPKSHSQSQPPPSSSSGGPPSASNQSSAPAWHPSGKKAEFNNDNVGPTDDDL